MPDQPTRPPRQFSEKETREILKRAAVLEGHGDEDPAFGLTTTELTRIAEESGISSQSVAAAIVEFTGQESTPSPNLWGGPLSLTLERVIPGTVSDNDWEIMVSEIRRTFKEVGRIEKRGRLREWSTGNARAEVRHYFVTVSDESGSTRVKITWSEPILAVPPYVLATTFAAVMIPVIFDSLGMVSALGVAVYLAVAATLLASARFIVSRSGSKKKEAVGRLMTTLESIALDGNRESHPEAQRMVR